MENRSMPDSGRKGRRLLTSLRIAVVVGLVLVVCSPTAARAPTLPPTSDSTLSVQEIATLSSLEKVDSHPLYTMHFYGSTELSLSEPASGTGSVSTDASFTWGCALFAALGGTEKTYGRNFDWEASPALLLFTHPTSGYASVSMVDLAYLGFGEDVDRLTELSLDDRKALLRAPSLPFDGMNDHGLVVGMAAVPAGDMQPDPDKDTVDSLMVMRLILDQAASVDEAVAVLRRYNIDWGGGPPLHYLIADRSGRAALVEFYQGSVHVIPNDKTWHLATNFLVTSVTGGVSEQCDRYDKASQTLSASAGSLNAQDAMSLLETVSQPHTQWSVVYQMNTGDVSITMGRKYGHSNTFQLDLAR
ncbi:MAG TPA: carcinine hydrolase/isopenicillin-N N-acyltransferase family protein [Clostridia bacterium]|nr:carcinine hydrolase/isopenicillin-N N-acyltransferase family protein [Clostridia bacterium]